MICVDGYKAFRGTMLVTPVNSIYPAFKVSGDFLYKPEYDCWYCRPNDGGFSRSFTADICEVVEDVGL